MWGFLEKRSSETSDVGRILESDILDIGEIACSGGQVNGLSDICSKP